MAALVTNDEGSSRDLSHGRFTTVSADVKAYYEAKLARHGASPRGVDWSCRATQELRFVQLLKICDFAAPFSLNDIGCGYGALCGFLGERYPEATIDYLGLDLSPAMVHRARRLYGGGAQRRFVVGQGIPRVADYSVASGIMNVKLAHSRHRWETYVATILRDMHQTSCKGFAVNFMAPASSAEEQLYRTSRDRWVGYCEGQLRCSVQPVTGYGLREFTLLVRRR
jgi:SAM-dependent methyltransferase